MTIKKFFKTLVKGKKIATASGDFNLKKGVGMVSWSLVIDRTEESTRQPGRPIHEKIHLSPESGHVVEAPRYRLIKDVHEMFIRLLQNGYTLDRDLPRFIKRNKPIYVAKICTIESLHRFAGHDVEKSDDWGYKITDRVGESSRIYYYFDPCIVEEYEG